jgi:hypothetical protein
MIFSLELRLPMFAETTLLRCRLALKVMPSVLTFAPTTESKELAIYKHVFS